MAARAAAPTPLTAAMKTSFAQRAAWMSAGVSTTTPATRTAVASACPFGDKTDPSGSPRTMVGSIPVWLIWPDDVKELMIRQ